MTKFGSNDRPLREGVAIADSRAIQDDQALVDGFFPEPLYLRWRELSDVAQQRALTEAEEAECDQLTDDFYSRKLAYQIGQIAAAKGTSVECVQQEIDAQVAAVFERRYPVEREMWLSTNLAERQHRRDAKR